MLGTQAAITKLLKNLGGNKMAYAYRDKYGILHCVKSKALADRYAKGRLQNITGPARVATRRWMVWLYSTTAKVRFISGVTEDPAVSWRRVAGAYKT